MSAIFTGKNIIYLDRVSSTNNVLSEMLSNSKPLADGSVIMAEEQSHGRGQHGTFWEASPGKNITISILYKPEFLTIDRQFYLSMAISLGISSFLEEELKQNVEIKWPNDIYVANRKIAGVLIENALINNHLKTSIIGIGLNVNQEIFHSGAPNPCSMKQLTGVAYNVKELVQRLFHHIEINYLNLKAGKYDYIRENYLAKLYKYQVEANYLLGDKPVKAKIIDLETSGRLVLLVDNERISVDTKEIEFTL